MHNNPAMNWKLIAAFALPACAELLREVIAYVCAKLVTALNCRMFVSKFHFSFTP